MRNFRNRKQLSAVWVSAVVLFSAAATRPCLSQTSSSQNSVQTASAQTLSAPPAAAAAPKKINPGGNSFATPTDVVYLPERPQQDTRLNMYFGDWHDSQPRAMFGSLVVRDILLPGDNLSPPFPGAVLEHAKYLSYGTLAAGARTVPSTLKGEQIFFYVMEGEGEISGNGKTAAVHKGSAILIPEGLEFTLHNTGETQLTGYMVGDATFLGFKPLADFAVKQEDKSRHGNPADTSPFTNPGAGGHWAHITHGFYNNKNGLASVGAIITVEILPMQLGEPHPHFPGHEEIWCEIEGKSLAFVGSQLRMQYPGQAYILRPDNLTTHSNLNFGEPGDKPIEFLWFSTSTKVSTTPH